MRNKEVVKRLMTFLLSSTMIFAVGSSAYANTQALPNGTINTQNGAKYLTDSKGNKYSGWFIDSKEDWYYFNESDKTMKTGWHHDNKDGYWYYLNQSDGKMVTGWQTIEGKEYFFQPVRDMGNYHFNNEQEKWLYSVNSKVPYGAMYVNTTTPDGSKVDSTGVKVSVETSTQTVNDNSLSGTDTIKNGWISENGSWHYYENGTLAKNKWLNLDGKWYYVLTDGGMVSNTWKEIGGKEYYFGSDGAMYANTTTPDGKKVDGNGNIIIISDENSSKEENIQIPKSQIIGTYEYDEGKEGGYYDGELHYNHVYTLVLYENNTFEYTYDNYFRVYNESGTYTYNDKQGEIIFSDNPFAIKGIIKDGGILISEYTDGELFFTSIKTPTNGAKQ